MFSLSAFCKKLRFITPALLGALASVFFVALITWAATTINNDVNTGGTLTVGGVSNLSGDVYASSTLQATGNGLFYSNVGIGTTNPTQGKVQIAGGTTSGLAIETNNDSCCYGIKLQNRSRTTKWDFISTMYPKNDGGFAIGTNARDDDFIIQANGNIALAAVGSGGSVGIGTTGPGSLLAVKGPGLFNSTTTIEGGGLIIDGGIMSTSTLGFYTKGTAAPRVQIDANGNVGIGTTSPGRPISVSSAATTTLFLDSTTAGNGTCIQMRTSGTLDRWAKLFIDDGGNLKSELGSC